jgi:hypothetical protein
MCVMNFLNLLCSLFNVIMNIFLFVFFQEFELRHILTHFLCPELLQIPSLHSVSVRKLKMMLTSGILC